MKGLMSVWMKKKAIKSATTNIPDLRNFKKRERGILTSFSFY